MKVFVAKGSGFSIPGYSIRVNCSELGVSPTFKPDRYLLTNLRDMVNRYNKEIAILLQNHEDVKMFDNCDIKDAKVFYSANDFNMYVSNVIAEANLKKGEDAAINDEAIKIVKLENKKISELLDASKDKLAEKNSEIDSLNEKIAELESKIKEAENKNNSMRELFSSICKKFNIYKNSEGELVQLKDDVATNEDGEAANEAESAENAAEDVAKPRRGRRKKEE